jgi:hypothetical protein
MKLGVPASPLVPPVPLLLPPVPLLLPPVPLPPEPPVPLLPPVPVVLGESELEQPSTARLREKSPADKVESLI